MNHSGFTKKLRGKGYYLPWERHLTAALLTVQIYIGLTLNVLVINLLSNFLSQTPLCECKPQDGECGPPPAKRSWARGAPSRAAPENPVESLRRASTATGIASELARAGEQGPALPRWAVSTSGQPVCSLSAPCSKASSGISSRARNIQHLFPTLTPSMERFH